MSTAQNWPTPPIQVVLFEPEIPPNTGNIARLCAGTGSPLHLIEPLGFQLTDKAMKRAGLDYWSSVSLQRHTNLQSYFDVVQPPRFWMLSTKGEQCYSDAVFAPGDALIFGSETGGLPDDFMEAHPDRCLTIPMQREHIRSLNLSNSVAIVLYEAIRQLTR